MTFHKLEENLWAFEVLGQGHSRSASFYNRNGRENHVFLIFQKIRARFSKRSS